MEAEPERPGTLYVVATPIGNLADLSERAAQVLRTVDLIAAENTRNAQPLLRHLDVRTRCVPYNDRNKGRTQASLVAALQAGKTVALISDAGTPGVSDPGQDLVAAAVEAGAEVVPVPGPSAATALLSVAGVRTRTARLLGFLPRKRGERRSLLTAVGRDGEPALAFESPHRVLESLADITAVLPGSWLVVGRELTKLHEEIWRGSPEEALAHFTPASDRGASDGGASGSGAPARGTRGEFTLLIVPAQDSGEVWDEARVRAALAEERAAGARRRQASVAVAGRSGWGRSDVYALWDIPP